MKENNKLIAEFMGWKTHSIHGDKYLENFDKNRKIPPYYVQIHNQGMLSDFDYHSDWNWLIPVIEKIESIKDKHHGHFGVHIYSNVCTIQATNFRPDKPIPNPPHYYSSYVLSNKIESTYKAVVEFIKWYNKQEQK